MTDFYRTLAQVSFTILGLWLVVVELRWKSWNTSARYRLGARAVTAHFALPGVMSLLSLADPSNTLLWRMGFAVLALMGAAGVLLFDTGARDSTLTRVGHWTALALYLAIALVAVGADILASGFGLNALQAEAVMLSLLIFLSLNIAFSLLFDAPADTFTG